MAEVMKETDERPENEVEDIVIVEEKPQKTMTKVATTELIEMKMMAMTQSEKQSESEDDLKSSSEKNAETKPSPATKWNWTSSVTVMMNLSAACLLKNNEPSKAT